MNPFRKFGVNVSYLDPRLEARIQGIEYDLQLRAIAAPSSVNAKDLIFAPPDERAPAPTGFGLIANVKAITANWNEVPIPDLLHYEIDIARDEAFTDDVKTHVTKETQYIFQQANINETRYAKVKAISQKGIAGFASGILNTTTAQVITNTLADGSVTTAKITDNAITVPTSAFSAGDVTVPGAPGGGPTTETTVQSLTFTTTGEPVIITFQASSINDKIPTGGLGDVPDFFTVRLKRGSTELLEYTSALHFGQEIYNYPIKLVYEDTPPSAGSVTYTVTYQMSSPSADTTVFDRILWSIESKK